MGYKVKVGDKTYDIKLPKWLGGKNDLQTSTPVSIGHAVSAKRQHYNQIDAVDKQLKEVGRSQTEKEIFDNDYTD